MYQTIGDHEAPQGLEHPQECPTHGGPGRLPVFGSECMPPVVIAMGPTGH